LKRYADDEKGEAHRLSAMVSTALSEHRVAQATVKKALDGVSPAPWEHDAGAGLRNIVAVDRASSHDSYGVAIH
jgi:hypothetical protein